MLRVNEVFPTIQGEAFWTGTPSTFIRLQGCPVACPWCDTKHTWPAGPSNAQVSTAQMLQKVNPASTWAELSPLEILGIVQDFTPRHFVITGGEPLAQNILPLTEALLSIGSVQVETSGTHTVNVATGTWVTVSPKIGMPGNLSIIDQAIDRANELKMPVETSNDIETLKSLLKVLPTSKQVWLQPISQGHAATKLCIDACMANNWKLSIQTHKFADIR